jgi:D-threo-aldose 1-dehydrogenase
MPAEGERMDTAVTHSPAHAHAPDGPNWHRSAGRIALPVTAIGLGGAPLASMPEVLGYEVPEERAVDLVDVVLASPIGIIDTSNGYGGGESERRIGQALRRSDSTDTVIITKVDAENGDYSGARVRVSVQESLERLGIDHLPLVHLHDPEYHDFDELTSAGGAVETLLDLRDRGVIGGIGVAGGHAPTIARYVDLGVFDALLIHNRLTLVDRSAETVVADAAGRGMAVFNAAVYGGGILATPHSGTTKYAYREASPALLEAVRDMTAVCASYGTDLATAALQHSLREEHVDCTLVGMSRPERVSTTLAAASQPLPDELWTELEALRPGPEHWLDAPR